ncbi:helix-turn-helix domain-containing protein [Pisciglobus halotolerans]|uniref:Transcriptional antiterminator n=1 Tax=Pisciglobus halotolerans TaxID=745365 RepID=A0A1I3CK01_9LACT|nr:helix-turn-helix domain-containing protein [Pisciglobus halotolerans]SFH74832.1 Transcriptional antiterminator [Pisciglobus halotolerans]
MRLLLDSSSLRRLQLLEILASQDGWLLIENIAKQLDCSQRSIKSDIQFFEHYFKEDLFIKTSKKNGIQLITPDFFEQNTIYQEIIKENLNVQLLSLLYEEQLHTLTDYAAYLYTSLSSVTRSMKQIKEALKKFDLSIKTKPVALEGREEQIRFFYCVFFWELTGLNFSELDIPFIDEATAFVQQLTTSSQESFSTVIISKMIVWTAVCLDRIQKGYLLKEYAPIVPVSQSVKQLIDESEKLLSFSLPANEKEFFGFYFMNRFAFTDIQSIKAHSNLWETYTDIGRFLEQLTYQQEVQMSNKEYVNDKLFKHYIYKEAFKGPNDLFWNPTRKTLLHSVDVYASFIDQTLMTLDQWQQPWTKKMKEEPYSFLYTLAVSWKNLTQQIIEKEKKICVEVVSQFGVDHEYFISELLIHQFPNKLECYPLSEVKKLQKKVDMVITDMKIDPFLQKQTDHTVPVVSIEYAPNHRNWHHIRTVLEKVEKQQR